MSSAVRSVLGAALLLTGASAAMAASDTATQGYQSAQTSTSTAVVASNNAAPAADQPAQTSAYSTVATSVNAPVAEQSSKPHSSICDKSDLYGGHGPSTHWGTRAFWDVQSNIQ
jgi:hypothetical protein